MLRKIRIALAVIFWAGITLLLLDISGVLHLWLGWMAKIQLLPAVMALNVAWFCSHSCLAACIAASSAPWGYSRTEWRT